MSGSFCRLAYDLGVTRQTVYRYFAGTDDLLAAVARSAAGCYFDRLARHLAQVTDPVEVVVDALAFTMERLPEERYLGVLLTAELGEFALRVLQSLVLDPDATGQSRHPRPDGRS